MSASSELVALRTGGIAASGPHPPQPLPLPRPWARERLPDVRSSKRRFSTGRNGFERVTPGRANSSPYKNLPWLACAAVETIQRRHLDAVSDCPRCNSTRGGPSSLAHWNGRGKRGRPPQAAGVIGEGRKAASDRLFRSRQAAFAEGERGTGLIRMAWHDHTLGDACCAPTLLEPR